MTLIKPTTDEIHRELRERICLLDLTPGARLTEEALAREFGVSRTPIRQVLDRLEFERLVDQHHGSGARVASLDSRELRDVWAVRLRVADLVGEFVKLPAPPQVLEDLRAIRDDVGGVRQSRDIRALGRLYNRFHATFLQMVANETLRWMHDVLFHQTAREWLRFLPEMDLDAELDIMEDELDQTLAALTDGQGDPERLAKLRAEHMRELLARFNAHLRGPE